MRAKTKKSKKVLEKLLIISFIAVLSYVIFNIFYMASFEQSGGVGEIPFLFTNDPPKERIYTLSDLYRSLVTKRKSIENDGIINDIIFHGPRSKRQIALTFDADMTEGMRNMLLSGQVASYYDKKLIDLLVATNTKATLFLTGMWVEMYPQVTKSLAEEPLFELGSHSYSHRSFAGRCYGLGVISEKEKVQDIGVAQMLLAKYGVKNSTFFRFPGGCYNSSDALLVERAGQRVVQWDVVANDGFNNNMSAIISNVVDRVKNGSIVVMHMNGYPNDPRTADAVKVIIEKLSAQSYSFVGLSELLAP